MKVTIDNYFDATKAEFKPVKKTLANEILRAYKDWVDNGKDGNCIVVNNDEYCVVHESIKHYSKSLYFKKKGSRSLIRISDHWSESKYRGIDRMNCGSIRTCFWTNPKGEIFRTKILKKKKRGDLMMAGKASFQSFKINTNENI